MKACSNEPEGREVCQGVEGWRPIVELKLVLLALDSRSGSSEIPTSYYIRCGGFTSPSGVILGTESLTIPMVRDYGESQRWRVP